MKKLYRDHRGSLEESLKTTFECPNGKADIVKHLEEVYPQMASNVRIEHYGKDSRLSEEWGDTCYVVKAAIAGQDGVMGFTNFQE